MERIFFTAILASISFTPLIAAEPFGIVKGTPIEKLETSDIGNKVILDSVPKPHPLFDLYLVWTSDSTGVCMVTAMSKEFDNDRFGANVRSEFEKISTALKGLYGDPERIDFLKSGGIWDDPDEWVMSIRQNERVFGDVFENVRQTDAGSNLTGLEMQISAFASDTSVIRLQYQFDNFEECTSAIDNEANSSF